MPLQRTWIVREGEDAKVDGKVEVRARERLEDCKAEQEVARLDPAGLDRVLSQERNDDRSAAEAAGKIENNAQERRSEVVSWSSTVRRSRTRLT